VLNSARCGVDIQCSAGQAVEPLPVADRVHTDFLWQRSPFKLDGQYNPKQREAGVDYLLPYWMLRYYTEVLRSPAVTHMDDTDPAIEYFGGWHRRADAAASGGGYHRRLGSVTYNGKSATPTARLVFTGDQISYEYGVSTIGGTAEVYIDGALRATVDYKLPQGEAADPSFGRCVTFDSLGVGEHEIRIEHRTGAVYVDGFRIASYSGEAEANTAAPRFRAETKAVTVLLGGALASTAAHSFDVESSGERVSVVVEGMGHAVSVGVFNLLGVAVASGGELIGGCAISGLDVDGLQPGSYMLVAVDRAGPPAQVTISIARTVPNNAAANE
jgi:hypothetical protein